MLLGASPTLRDKLHDSGTSIALDNYFTSPVLFECLASHDIFAVGTCRTTRTSGAASYLQSLDRKLTKKGDMHYCRSGETGFVQWKDAKDVTFCSTIHIAEPSEEEREAGGGIDHVTPVPYE